MSAYELAQLNIGIIRGPMDSPVMAEFAANLARINALADAAPGFVWRLQTEAGDATALRPFEDPNTLLNMSVWRDLESLRQYVYASAHLEIMRRRREWFARIDEAYLVLWWVARGHRPSIAEALERLAALRARGAHSEAFTFRAHYPPPDADQGEAPGAIGAECPAL
ncbi:MAG TPA: DUF3291 domain-containing protein [Steroidobacteraceae bacterium]|nr:DUF3291 domain-containing protein [Steroidobacteraceae bacterium]